MKTNRPLLFQRLISAICLAGVLVGNFAQAASGADTSLADAFKKSAPVKPRSKGPRLALVNTSKYQVKKSSEVKASILSGSVEVSRSSSLYDQKNGTKSEGMEYLMNLRVQLPTGALSTSVSYSQDLNSETAAENSSINDSNMTYTHGPFELAKNERGANVSWAPQIAGLIPLSKRSQDVQQLQTAIIGSAILKVVAGKESQLAGAGLSLSLSAGQAFHRYETDVNGVILNKYSSNQSIAVLYGIKYFVVTISYANKIRWPYRGSSTTTFELTQDLTYTFLKSWSASIGHTNAASALKPNGYDSNVNLIDENSSVVYFGMAYGF